MPSLIMQFFLYISLLVSIVPNTSAQVLKEKKIPKTGKAGSSSFMDPAAPQFGPKAKRTKAPAAPKTTAPSTSQTSLDGTLGPHVSPSTVSTSPSPWTNKQQPTLQPNTTTGSQTRKPSIRRTASPLSPTQTFSSSRPSVRKVNVTRKPSRTPVFQSQTPSIPPTVFSTSVPSVSTRVIPTTSNSPVSKPTSAVGFSSPSQLPIKVTSELSSKPTSKNVSTVHNATTASTVVTTTVNVPEFSLLLFFGGGSNKRRTATSSDVITQSFTGDSVLTAQVSSFLTSNFQNLSQVSQLTYLRIVSISNGSTIYAIIQPNLTIGKQWIAANYSGYTSFQGSSKTPTSDDLGLVILNAFSPSNGQATFLAALHSTDNLYLQQVTEVRVALKNGPITIQIQPTTKGSSILAGTVIASAVCLMFVSATVYLIHRNRKKKGKYFSDKVSIGYSRSSPPLYISIPHSERNNITADMTTTTTATNIFDVALVSTTCWNTLGESSSNLSPSYTFESIKAPSGGSRGSSSLEQILEESSCCDSVPAITQSFELANTSQNLSFNSDDTPSTYEDGGGETWDQFYTDAVQSSPEAKTDTDGSSSCSMSLPAISPSAEEILLETPAQQNTSLIQSEGL